MKGKPFIIPIFLPQWGCPHRCIYCDQTAITGESRAEWNRGELDGLVEKGLASQRRRADRPVEIAFYGANFTGLPGGRQESLLAWGSGYVRRGLAAALRLSTRPDAVSEAMLPTLWSCGVRTVELGFQALDDTVLERIRRDHTVGDNLRALVRLKQAGFTVGVQLMPGLPGDSPDRFLHSLTGLLIHKPDFVRIYPALVFRGTILSRWYREGSYRPPALESMVDLCCRAVALLEEAGIPVIRLGLHNRSERDFRENLLAGPFHPAFGDLVRARLFQQQLCRDLQDCGPHPGTELELRTGSRETGYLLGNGRLNLEKVMSALGTKQVRVVQDPALAPGAWQASWTG